MKRIPSEGTQPSWWWWWWWAKRYKLEHRLVETFAPCKLRCVEDQENFWGASWMMNQTWSRFSSLNVRTCWRTCARTKNCNVSNVHQTACFNTVCPCPQDLLEVFFFYIYFFIALLILTLVIRSVTLRRAVSYEHEQRGRLLAYPAPCLEVFTAVPDVDYV